MGRIKDSSPTDVFISVSSEEEENNATDLHQKDKNTPSKNIEFDKYLDEVLQSVLEGDFNYLFEHSLHSSESIIRKAPSGYYPDTFGVGHFSSRYPAACNILKANFTNIFKPIFLIF